MNKYTETSPSPSYQEGLFVVVIVYSNGAYRLVNPDGDMLMMPINGKFLKKYYL